MAKNYYFLLVISSIGFIISILSMPLVVKLYSASEIKQFGIFLSLHLIIATSIGLRHEISIIASRSIREANENIALTCLISTGMGILSYCTYVATCNGFFGITLSDVCSDSGDYALLLIASALIFAQYNILFQYCIYLSAHPIIRAAKFLQVLLVVLLQLLIGYFTDIVNGLIVGLIVGNSITVITLIWLLRSDLRSLYNVRFSKLHSRLRFDVYRFNLPEALLNSFTANFPYIALAYVLTDLEYVVVYIALKILSSSSNIIVSTSSSTFNSALPKSEKLYHLVKTNLMRDSLVLITGVVCLSIVPESFFSWLFNESFRDFKWYLVLLIPWFFARTLFSSISYVFVYMKRLRYSFIIITTLSIFKFASYLLMWWYDPIFVVGFFGFLYYVSYGYFLLKSVRLHDVNSLD